MSSVLCRGPLHMARFMYSAAMSLDGFIAGPRGDMSWMADYFGPNPVVDELITPLPTSGGQPDLRRRRPQQRGAARRGRPVPGMTFVRAARPRVDGDVNSDQGPTAAIVIGVSVTVVLVLVVVAWLFWSSWVDGLGRSRRPDRHYRREDG